MSTTTISYRLQAAVQAKPGMQTRAVAESIGIKDAKGIARVSALLHQCWQRGKVRRETIDGQLHHHPTTLTCLDLRVANRKPGKRSDQRKELRTRKRVAKPSIPTPGRRIPAPKPSREQVAKLSALFNKPTRLKPTERTETVAEFQARGGVIQRLPSGACSRPLASFGDDDAFPL